MIQSVGFGFALFCFHIYTLIDCFMKVYYGSKDALEFTCNGFVQDDN